MVIALRHPLVAKIDDRVNFLKYLLKEYPTFLEEWENKTMKEFEQIAKVNSNGDKEVENDIFSSLCTAFDDDEGKIDIFYQSVLLMCYSLYESCVAKLSKEANTKEKINAICQSKSISLSQESTQAMEYLQNDINALRNDICHNNLGTYRRSAILKKLSEKNIGVNYDCNGCNLAISDSKFIEDTLDKIHMVLRELCEKFGYKTKIYPRDFKP